MKQSYFMKIYRKRWTYRLIALGLMAITVIGLLCVGTKVYYDNTNSPTIVKSIEEYKKALNEDSYIKISADKLYDLDVEMIETTSKFNIKISEETRSKFVAIKLAGYILPIELSNEEYEKFMNQEKGPYILKGTLTETKDRDLKILSQSIETNKELANNTKPTPYYQYLEYKTPIKSVQLYFIVAALWLAYALALFIFIMRKNSIALKALKNYSNGDIESVCQQIDNEITLSDVYKNGPITITQNYIIVDTQKIVFALPLRELMWVYKETVKRRVYGFIPAGKTHSLVLVFSDKRTYKLDTLKHEKIIDETIKYVSENKGICFSVYSEELKKLFDKNTEEFILEWKKHKESSVKEAI